MGSAEHPPSPAASYVICATPRSGSNLLCDLLTRSDAMGRPSELFNAKSTVLPLASRYGLHEPDGSLDLRKYLGWAEEKYSTPNGVFGTKILFGGQLEWAIEFKAVRDLLRRSKLILLTRMDIVAQAVSRHMARGTLAWTLRAGEENVEPAPDPSEASALEYSQATLERLVKELAHQNRCWLEFFAVNGLDFYPVTYEQLTADPDATCHAICRYCGVRTEHEFSVERSALRRQESDLKSEFRDRYKRASRLNMDELDTRPSEVMERRGVNIFESSAAGVRWKEPV